MKELDENCVYSLEELTSEEKQKLLEKLIELDNTWDGESSKEELFTSNFLYFSDDYKTKGEWLVSQEKPYTSKKTVNAKYLFAEPQYEVKYIAEEPKETFNPQPHYNNDKGSLYKVAEDRNWNAYLFDVVKRLERGGKKDPLEQEIQKSIDVLKLWLIEATQ